MKHLAARRLRWAAALALPLIVFSGVWADTHYRAQQGQDWLIPVKGYDPRDLLRGHYIQYRYDWPANRSAYRDAGAPSDFDPATQDALCIRGTAPNIRRVSGLAEPTDDGNPAPSEPCAIVVRATLGTRQEVRGLDTGILFVSQARAKELGDKLADPKLQGLIKVRIRPDGVMRPIDMAFRPRPRPATPAPSAPAS